MTKLHTIDYYMDGHVAIAFCKICSAEGDKLLEDCYGGVEKISEDEADFAQSLLTNNNRLLNRKY